MEWNFDSLAQQFQTILTTYGYKFIGAILALIVGLFIIKALTGGVNKMLNRSNKIDATLKPFLGKLFNVTLKVLLIISVLSMAGIAVTSFIALLGAAGLAIGMAFSGTLSNFAGGVMLLIFKPFKVGDVIEAQGFIGAVQEISIFNTILKSPDNKTIIIPNGGLSTGSMVNYTTEPLRRVDFTYGIAYGDDVKKAKDLLLKIISEDKAILNEPAGPFVEVVELADSSVNFAVRVWAKTEDYWDVFFRMNTNVYTRFNENGINIPFPQMDVHLFNK
jgi:small conductance mechanosensitive channel